jgi:hypothetical protein
LTVDHIPPVSAIHFLLSPQPRHDRPLSLWMSIQLGF